MIRPWNEVGQGRHHLTTIADSKGELFGVGEKGSKFIPQTGMMQNGSRPSLTCTQNITVTEPATSGETVESG